MSSNFGLIIMPNFQIRLLPKNRILMDRKSLDGLFQYSGLWPGPVTVFVEENSQGSGIFQEETIDKHDLPFKLEVLSFNALTKENFLKYKSSVVLASVGYRQNHVSRICRSSGNPCVYISEYSLKTRQQIINLNTSNPLLRFRRHLWEKKQEIKRTRALAVADGVQCNGTPTYEVYRRVNHNAILYFDTRVTEAMLATSDDIGRRYHARDDNTPLRLLFSGRLAKVKGADHLLDVAKELKQLAVKFEMFICGDGELKEAMNRRILTERLSDCVELTGVLDFKTELLPFARSNIDLFICCHRQGDPSCTYLETMSCGIPIIGYDNEAFRGIVNQSKAGWLVEMDRPRQMAQQIVTLDRSRDLIKSMAFKSLAFARRHTFEKVFAARISHLQRTVTKAAA